MASHLEVFVIIDEGGSVLEEYFGQTCVGDTGSSDSRLQGKEGSVNIKVSVNVPGGHSCIPYIYSYVASPCIVHRHSVSASPTRYALAHAPFFQNLRCRWWSTGRLTTSSSTHERTSGRCSLPRVF
ncbi:hypothetical protein B0H19DRAFT_1162252 [Mycena capillaripes]|nr:hypothetical protein B0H19DRAFT_1162252 [Mycena capillaripes]